MRSTSADRDGIERQRPLQAGIRRQAPRLVCLDVTLVTQCHLGQAPLAEEGDVAGA